MVRREGSLLVADARVDALLDGYETRSDVGPEALDYVLGADGPAGLWSVAADFAAARYDRATASVTLVRDAFGLRPLYWARRGSRIGFASDPEVLIGLGLASWEADPDAVISWLHERADVDDRTCLRGIRRVMPGRWVRIDGDGSASGGRWFRPERMFPDESLDLSGAASEARAMIVAAAASRARGRRVALMLSGGRDSSSVAVALAEAGITAICITYVLQAEGVRSEAPMGKQLAESLGHEWVELPVGPRLQPERVAKIVRLTGGPLRGISAPIQLKIHDLVRDLGVDTVLEGEGGDLLFSAFPIAVLDLLRQARLRLAAEAIRNYHHHWSYRYPVTGKIVLRGLIPRPAIAFRERVRPQPPWLIRPAVSRLRHDRSDVGYLRDILRHAIHTSGEAPERIFRSAGATLAWPLCDMRVLRLSLRLPTRLRVPVPGPKPVLGRAFLQGREKDLVKLPLDGFARDLAASYRVDFPAAFTRDSLIAERRLIREGGLVEASDPRWAWDTANILGVEAWLRQVEAERGR